MVDEDFMPAVMTIQFCERSTANVSSDRVYTIVF